MYRSFGWLQCIQSSIISPSDRYEVICLPAYTQHYKEYSSTDTWTKWLTFADHTLKLIYWHDCLDFLFPFLFLRVYLIISQHRVRYWFANKPLFESLISLFSDMFAPTNSNELTFRNKSHTYPYFDISQLIELIRDWNVQHKSCSRRCP